MNFFENELQKMFGNTALFNNPQIIGSACHIKVTDSLFAKISIIAQKYRLGYDAINVSLKNVNTGIVDVIEPRFDNFFPDMPGLNIYADKGTYRWTHDSEENKNYLVDCELTVDMYELIGDKIKSYLSIFQESGQQLSEAPLMEDIEQEEQQYDAAPTL